ncbi:MAG: ABC transporter permease [Spirochaetota bacterium]
MRTAKAIAILWLRDMKRFFRSPSRIIGNIVIPFFLLVSIGAGFGRAMIPGIKEGTTYLGFLVPGMLGMTMLFSGMFSGLSVLWDRQFGFLKEIMVAPVSRVAIVIGRIVSGATIGVFQAVMILIASQFLGFRFSLLVLPAAVGFMMLISFIFTSIGLIFASRMKDEQGFGLVMNFLIMPVLFLSGAFAPITNLPSWVQVASFADPLTYGIEGLRALLIGSSAIPIFLCAMVCTVSAVVLVLIAAWAFETSEVV